MPYILLSSARNDLAMSRSFNEFETKAELSELIIQYHDDWLTTREAEPGNEAPSLQYTSEDLFRFMSEFFGELCCLVKEESTGLWIPYTIDWIKETIYLHLRSQSNPKTLSMQPFTDMTTATANAGGPSNAFQAPYQPPQPSTSMTTSKPSSILMEIENEAEAFME